MTASRYFASIGAISAFIGVGAGAFGAHALRGQISADLLQTWETGARYQVYHAFALIACAWVASTSSSPWAERAGWSFIVGTFLFSGSLYALALSASRALGAVTPFGGLALLAGWIMLAVAAKPTD
jgi:uncharacterized membrane protein YgdD (TMEM256/DUF423 family)